MMDQFKMNNEEICILIFLKFSTVPIGIYFNWCKSFMSFKIEVLLIKHCPMHPLWKNNFAEFVLFPKITIYANFS